MKRQELIVLMMIAEGRADDVFAFMPRALACAILDELVKQELLEDPQGPEMLSTKITDRARVFLEALDTVPLPQKVWTMNQSGGE